MEKKLTEREPIVGWAYPAVIQTETGNTAKKLESIEKRLENIEKLLLELQKLLLKAGGAETDEAVEKT